MESPVTRLRSLSKPLLGRSKTIDEVVIKELLKKRTENLKEYLTETGLSPNECEFIEEGSLCGVKLYVRKRG